MQGATLTFFRTILFIGHSLPGYLLGAAAAPRRQETVKEELEPLQEQPWQPDPPLAVSTEVKEEVKQEVEDEEGEESGPSAPWLHQRPRPSSGCPEMSDAQKKAQECCIYFAILRFLSLIIQIFFSCVKYT